MPPLKFDRIGIWGTGFVTGDVLRGNDWWPREIVERWHAPRMENMNRARAAREHASPLQRTAIDSMLELADDPFYGVTSRWHLAAERSTADLAETAARNALDAADILPADVDYLLNADFVPPQIATNTACNLHERLNLRRSCMCASVDTSANSFLTQFQLAASLIATGQARHVLTVQTAVTSRVLPFDQDYSAVFGDACTAVVLGPVRDGYGLLSTTHATDGSLQNAVVAGVPGRDWWDEGRVVLYTPDMAARGRMFMTLPTLAVELSQSAMASAHTSAEDVRFFASHQGLSWLRAVAQSSLGLVRAQHRETYPTTGNLSPCNVVASLDLAAREGTLEDGDPILAWTGGNGSTSSAAVIRWGGRHA